LSIGPPGASFLKSALPERVSSIQHPNESRRGKLENKKANGKPFAFFTKKTVFESAFKPSGQILHFPATSQGQAK
jgi:hypothetical protein